jgi:hypothetical protein
LRNQLKSPARRRRSALADECTEEVFDGTLDMLQKSDIKDVEVEVEVGGRRDVEGTKDGVELKLKTRLRERRHA